MSFTRRAAIAASLAAIALAAAGSYAHAHSYTLGDLRIDHPWTRATPPSAKVAGGFLTIENRGTTADRLLSAVFEGSNITEVHEMAMDKGVMRMRELPKGIAIPAGGKLELKPGGYHLMFIDMKRGIKEGESLKGSLVFEKAGRIDVDFKVEAMGARGGGHDHHNHAPKTN